MEELDQSKKWRAVVADLKRQVDRVIEIGDAGLAEYSAAAINDCIIEYQQGTIHLRDAGRKTAMSLTPHFSRVRANGEFLHEENMNLPPQEGEYPWEKEGYCPKDAYDELRKHRVNDRRLKNDGLRKD